jgi:hypothetical protein
MTTGNFEAGDTLNNIFWGGTTCSPGVAVAVFAFFCKNNCNYGNQELQSFHFRYTPV